MSPQENENLSVSDAEAKIIDLDAKATEAKTKRQHAKMLRYMEEALSLRVTFVGREDHEVQSAAHKLVKEYNSVAMQLLREGLASEPAHLIPEPLHLHCALLFFISRKRTSSSVANLHPQTEALFFTPPLFLEMISKGLRATSIGRWRKHSRRLRMNLY